MANRQKLIQLIHIGASKLFSDDEARRAWQQQHTGKTSCKEMTQRELEYLVKLLRDAKAITPPRRAGRVPVNPSPYMEKIEALLADMKLSWQYAEAIAWRITGGRGNKPNNRPGVRRLEWVNKEAHFVAIIAALDTEQQKRDQLQYIDSMLADLELDYRYIEQMVQGQLHADKWQRNLPLLKDINQQLYAKWEAQRAAQ